MQLYFAIITFAQMFIHTNVNFCNYMESKMFTNFSQYLMDKILLNKQIAIKSFFIVT